MVETPSVAASFYCPFSLLFLGQYFTTLPQVDQAAAPLTREHAYPTFWNVGPPPSPPPPQMPEYRLVISQVCATIS